MKTNNKQPLLSFEFATSTGEVKPVTFINPIKTIVANKIEDIFHALSKSEAVEQGFYAAGYVSYESAPAFDSAFQVSENPNMPLLWFGIFQNPLKKVLLVMEAMKIQNGHQMFQERIIMLQSNPLSPLSKMVIPIKLIIQFDCSHNLKGTTSPFSLN